NVSVLLTELAEVGELDEPKATLPARHRATLSPTRGGPAQPGALAQVAVLAGRGDVPRVERIAARGHGIDVLALERAVLRAARSTVRAARLECPLPQRHLAPLVGAMDARHAAFGVALDRPNELAGQTEPLKLANPALADQRGVCASARPRRLAERARWRSQPGLRAPLWRAWS